MVCVYEGQCPPPLGKEGEAAEWTRSTVHLGSRERIFGVLEQNVVGAHAWTGREMRCGGVMVMGDG